MASLKGIGAMIGVAATSFLSASVGARGGDQGPTTSSVPEAGASPAAPVPKHGCSRADFIRDLELAGMPALPPLSPMFSEKSPPSRAEKVVYRAPNQSPDQYSVTIWSVPGHPEKVKSARIAVPGNESETSTIVRLIRFLTGQNEHRPPPETLSKAMRAAITHVGANGSPAAMAFVAALASSIANGAPRRVDLPAPRATALKGFSADYALKSKVTSVDFDFADLMPDELDAAEQDP